MSLELTCKIHETKVFNRESEIQCIQSSVVRFVLDVIVFIAVPRCRKSDLGRSSLDAARLR